jgi:hypothetical protein
MLVELLLESARRRGSVPAVSDQLATLNYRRLRAFAGSCATWSTAPPTSRTSD